ncbi:MAG: hypothetical protein ACQER9_03245 [Nanobdellota archaeon]
MYNFKLYGKTFKGLAGECMFQLTRSNLFLTRFFPKEFVLRKYGHLISDCQKKFIIENWLSFDAIEFGKNIVLYEIKTRNVEYQRAGHRLKLTQNCMNIYSEAEKINFKVKFAVVLLHDNWNYSVIIDNFNFLKNKVWIYTKNKYDKSNGYR